MATGRRAALTAASRALLRASPAPGSGSAAVAAAEGPAAAARALRRGSWFAVGHAPSGPGRAAAPPEGAASTADLDAARARLAAAKARQAGPSLLQQAASAAAAAQAGAGAVAEGTRELAAQDAKQWRATLARWWAHAKHEAKHYWAGFKLLGVEVRIATRHTAKLVEGRSLTRRERKQLTRTVADLFRLVPFLAFILIPFMELLLPVALKLFPNMLPSTFQDRHKAEEELKKRLKAKLEMAHFLQDTYTVMAKDLRRSNSKEATRERAADLDDFLGRVRRGEPVTNDQIVRFAKLFNDELTLDNCERAQLVAMCKFVAIKPYGTDAFLRFQLRRRLRELKQDDRLILAEGLDALSSEELRAACRARGMRWDGESVDDMREQLADWLDLSLNHALPSSLLILSRAFTITHTRTDDTGTATMQDLSDTLAALPDELVINVEAEACAIENTTEDIERRIEYIRHQEELIEEEEEDFKAEQTREEEEKTLASGKELGAAEMEAATREDELSRTAAEPSEVSQDEREEASAAKRRRELRKLSSALTSLASSSSVDVERAEFTELLEHELSKYQDDAEVGDSTDQPEVEYSSSMSTRIDKLLHRIEKELDQVDETIGVKMKTIDLDGDGKLSLDEISQACAALREKLDGENLQGLLEEAGLLREDGSVLVEDLMRLAAEEEEEEDEDEDEDEQDEKVERAA